MIKQNSPEVRFSIFPLYGDASVLVVDAEDLREAIEKAFQVKLEFVHEILQDTETSPIDNSVCLFYAVRGALGKRDNHYSVLCSATVLTYVESPARITKDLLSVASLMTRRFAA